MLDLELKLMYNIENKLNWGDPFVRSVIMGSTFITDCTYSYQRNICLLRNRSCFP